MPSPNPLIERQTLSRVASVIDAMLDRWERSIGANHVLSFCDRGLAWLQSVGELHSTVTERMPAGGVCSSVL
jgi:hypothetical protein